MNQLEQLDMRAQTFKLETVARVFWYDSRLAYGATLRLDRTACSPSPHRATIVQLSTTTLAPSSTQTPTASSSTNWTASALEQGLATISGSLI